MKKQLSDKLIMIGIFLLAAVLRLYNPNWDHNFHLHPDERFLTLVGTAMKLPTSFSQYLNPQSSLFNPANIGYKFYVYGMFPVIVNKLIAIASNADNYNDFTIIGRMLSAGADLLIMGLVFKLAFLFKKHHKLPQSLPFFSIFFYATTVFAIQQSHFFTVDTFLSFFVLASLYCMLKFSYEKTFVNIFFSGLFFALAIASKVSGVYILPLLLFFLFSGCIRAITWNRPYKNHFFTHILSKDILLRSTLALVIFFATFYFTLRLSDPYYFKDSNIFNIHLNPLFLENIHQLQALGIPTAWFPPSVQWVHKTPVLFSLYNFAFWGVGIIYFLFIVMGIFFLLKKHRQFELLAILIWVICFFLYQSSQFAQTMRYLFPLYPLLAIYAAIGFYYLTIKWAGPKIKIGLILILLLYPLSFMSIYVRPVSRVTASQWIFQHIAPTHFLLTEHWDDSLPLPLIAQQYGEEALPVFDPDTPMKWEKINELLKKGDYLILSSNRGWGSIPTVPERYPQMTKFYKDLFAERLIYKKVAEFTSYPSLEYLGIPLTLPDDSAEEAFTVYDHPKVMIFQKRSSL